MNTQINLDNNIYEIITVLRLNNNKEVVVLCDSKTNNDKNLIACGELGTNEIIGINYEEWKETCAQLRATKDENGTFNVTNYNLNVEKNYVSNVGNSGLTAIRKILVEPADLAIIRNAVARKNAENKENRYDDSINNFEVSAENRDFKTSIVEQINNNSNLAQEESVIEQTTIEPVMVPPVIQDINSITNEETINDQPIVPNELLNNDNVDNKMYNDEKIEQIKEELNAINSKIDLIMKMLMVQQNNMNQNTPAEIHEFPGNMNRVA